MQSVAVISSPVSGVVYINGRFAGECGAESPIIMPVNPHGAMYLELKPFGRGGISSLHRLDFSGGELNAERVPEGVYVIKWPGGITEIETIPVIDGRGESEYSNMDGLPIAILREKETYLRVGGGRVSVPEGAALPDLHISGAAELFAGNAKGGRYAACFSKEGLYPLGAINADSIEIDEGAISALSGAGDTVGHARLENWSITGDGLLLNDAEYIWENGAPHWPKDADKTMLAAFEAHFLGLESEADGYLAPRARNSGLLARAAEGCEMCLPLRYAPPSANRCIGLLKRETARCAKVARACFSASPAGGGQGSWLIDDIYPANDD